MVTHPATRPNYRLFVGAAGSATHLTATWMQPGEQPSLPMTFAPTSSGIATFQQRLATTHIIPAHTLVVPHTGSPAWLELALTLHQAGYAVSPVSQMYAANLADDLLSDTTSGTVDASTLTHLAALLQPAPWSPTTVTAATVQRLLDERAALMYALEHGSTAPYADLHAQLDVLEQRLAALLANDAAWMDAAQRLTHLSDQGLLAALWHTVTTRISQHFSLLPSSSRPDLPRDPQRALRAISRPVALAALAAALAAPPIPQTHATGPAGDVFTVNDLVTGAQEKPAVAMDDDGDFVVVWQSDETSIDGYDRLYAKLYNSDGSVAQSPITVTVGTSGLNSPDVAMDDDGDFVVVWKEYGAGNFEYIFARRYNAAGAAQDTPPIQVASATVAGDSVKTPAVAMDSVGNFIVAWDETFNVPGFDIYDGIYARQYNSDGTLQSPITVEETDAYNTVDFANPDVAMDDDGDFVVAYDQEDNSYYYFIFVKSYNNAGTLRATRNPDFIIRQGNTSGSVERPAVAMDDDGNFVVAWDGAENYYGTTPATRKSYIGYEAVAADGTPIVLDQEISVTGFDRVNNPDVAIDDDGDFVIVYAQETSPTNSIKYLAHNAQGVPDPEGIQDAVEVATTVGNVYEPAIDTDASGNFVIAWEYFEYAPTSDRNIEARLFFANLAPTLTATAGNLDYTEGDPATIIDSAITLSDADDTELTGATVEITSGLDGSTDELSVIGSLPGGITADVSAAGKVTLSGSASVADYQAALRQIAYTYTGDSFSAGTRTVTFTADDGTDTSSATRVINLVSDPVIPPEPTPESTVYLPFVAD